MAEHQRFPGEVAVFIASCIDSVEQVEILLALRANPARHWTPEQLSRDQHSSIHSVHLRLQHLVACGLVGKEGSSYFYAAPAGADRLVQRLAELYADRRSAVIERIFSDRKDPLQPFSDAFRLREDTENHE